MQIGLLCGSFNPVHNGHMAIAGYMAEFTNLEQVWMVVSPHNPLKPAHSLLNDYQRLKLMELAIGKYKKIKASNVEFALPKPSYTINTLNHLTKKFPQHTFTLIIGSDNLETFTKWKSYDEILDKHQVFVYPRINSNKENFIKHPNIKFIDAPLLEISSTSIRNAIKNKKDVRYLLPEKVFECIDDMRFYV